MNPTGNEEQLDYEHEEYGGAQKLHYQGSGAIPALADDEMMGEDDDYDDLYSDVNVGESFQQMQQLEPPVAVGRVRNGGAQLQTPKVEAGIPGSQMPGAADFNRPPSIIQGSGGARNMGFQGSFPVPTTKGADPNNMTVKLNAEPAPTGKPINVGPIPTNINPMQTSQMRPVTDMNSNVNHPMINENQIRPPIENGSTMIFVGELNWWTTDADLECVLNQYGRVKEIKFFDEKASGKSKGYCQVEFFDPAAAANCKESMNGYLFNERACVVAFASPQTLKQMGSSYTTSRNPFQNQGRRPMGDGVGRGSSDGGGRSSGVNYQGGDGGGRGFGRGGWARGGGQGMANRGPPSGPPIRGRGAAVAAAPRGIAGNGVNPGGFGQGMMGPAFGGPPGAMNMMHAQGMMGAGFDPTFMGQGGGYGGFPGAGFPGMMPSYPSVNPMGLGMVAPHVNPAFFGRGMTPNGMGMMGPTGMGGPHPGMWTDPSMNEWGGGTGGGGERGSSYGGGGGGGGGGDDGGSEYGYEESSHEKGGARSNPASHEKVRGAPEPDRTRHREDREHDRGRSDRDHKGYREETDPPRDNHSRRERDRANGDEYDRGQSSRPRSRSRVISEDDHRDSRSRDVDYGKRRRLPSE